MADAPAGQCSVATALAVDRGGAELATGTQLRTTQLEVADAAPSQGPRPATQRCVDGQSASKRQLGAACAPTTHTSAAASPAANRLIAARGGQRRQRSRRSGQSVFNC